MMMTCGKCIGTVCILIRAKEARVKPGNNEGQSANIILATARLFHPFSAHGLVPHIQTMQMFSLQSDILEIDSEPGSFIAKVQYGSSESISSFNFNPLIQA